jgi:hypothetical protein
MATLQTERHVVCFSRTCECGSIALGAFHCDGDEIIDDAIGIFAVQIRPESRGLDHLLINDIRRAGVEIRTGELVQGRPDIPKQLAYQFLWFRRSPPVATDPS